MKIALTIAMALAIQIPSGDPPSLTIAPVTLHGAEKAGGRAGALAYAGGLYLTSSASRFGGLSGIEAKALPDGGVSFQAVTDAGDFVRFTGRLDEAGQLVGAQDLTLVPLRDSQGQVFPYKAAGDAEDISLLPDRPGALVSFEGHNRIVAYADPLNPTGAQGQVELPQRAKDAKPNGGIEAVAALPGGTVAIGAENGRIWICPRGQTVCPLVAKATPFSIGPSYTLSSFDHLADGELIAVYRAKAVFAHWNAKIVHIKVVDGEARFTELADLRAFVGNMEGISAVRTPDGRGWRLYLISDNGFDPKEANLLLAFDWRP